jgi:hypothetical protein
MFQVVSRIEFESLYFKKNAQQSFTVFYYHRIGCSPVKFWYFGRHGTRNPGTGDIKAMQEILPKLHEEVVEALSKGLNSQPDKCHFKCEHTNV